jgi:hypothetical protein
MFGRIKSSECASNELFLCAAPCQIRSGGDIRTSFALSKSESASKQEKSKADNHHRFKPFCLIVFQHLQRPKSFAPAKLGQERRSHGHHFIDHPDPIADRRSTGMAV